MFLNFMKDFVVSFFYSFLVSLIYLFFYGVLFFWFGTAGFIDNNSYLIFLILMTLLLLSIIKAVGKLTLLFYKIKNIRLFLLSSSVFFVIIHLIFISSFNDVAVLSIFIQAGLLYLFGSKLLK